MAGNPTWTHRLQITSHALHVAAFGAASLTLLLTSGPNAASWVAAGAGLIGVLLSFTIRVPFEERQWQVASALAGSMALYTVAITLTGGESSPYTLLPVAAIFLAAAGGTARFAVPTSIAAIGGFFLASWLSNSAGDFSLLIRVPATYAITAIAFSEAFRAIASETRRTDGLIVAVGAAQTRVARLTATHELLSDLVQVAQSPDINAVTTARDAIRDVGLVVRDAPCRIVTEDSVVLARRGIIPDHPSSYQYPIHSGEDQVARLEFWDGMPDLDDREAAAVLRAVEPVGIAIENDMLLQQVAGITIQRERVRLARELHDDVAPSIAAVGLALDMALMSGELDSEQSRNLAATRLNVSRLVEQIRARVQDLRADRSASVVEMAHSLVAEVDTDGPTVIVNIDERTPPRSAIAAELEAFLSEAFRNALGHSGATAIWVTGRIAEGDGFLAVQDNGAGFEPSSVPDGHFGIIGMRERAAVIAATFELKSAPGEGTVVSITWRDETG